ncbi:MAG TPA: hypothetical protein P5567_08290 [Kiritimatiellia bacterium]|nr:hypothetical protein [Kiritimatiellia bacterium]HRZ12440.1 hypothetical protein [Kiritimatiellia bacterium]HSA17802.1 hypothetical protein [Kiritimatiellia bacterium]
MIADTHVHLYRCYDIPDTIRKAIEHLRELARAAQQPDALPVLCLTERHDHHVFDELKSGRLRLDPGKVSALPDEPAGLRIDGGSGEGCAYLLAGRQVITRERIEVLGLAMASFVEDGLPLEDTVARVRAQGGLPVLSWAPGKWFFGRGRIVGAFISRSAPGDLLLGDTSLRPLFWGEPRLMRAGRRRGLRVVSGSDPLPFAEDARWAGRVATVYAPAPMDEARPVAAIARRLLQDTPLRERAGARLCPSQVALRLLRNRKARGMP